MGKYSGAIQGINEGLEGLIRQQNLDREFNLRSQLARDSNRRAEEQYQYGISRRPMQEQMDANTLKQQGITTQKMQRASDAYDIKADQEGVVTAMRYLFAGQPEEAKRVYNSRGDSRITNIQPHPDDPDQSLWLIEEDDGSVATVDPYDMLKKLGALDDGKNRLRGRDVIPVKDAKGIARYQTPEGAIGMEVPPSELGRGRGSSRPAILQETDAVYERLLQQNPKANKNDLWLQAHSIASQKGSNSIDDAAAKFYQGLFTKLLPDYASDEETEKAKATAKRLTQEYVKELESMRGIQPSGGAGGAGSGIQDEGGGGMGVGGPRKGEIVDGYRFIGGDPYNPKSWERAQ